MGQISDVVQLTITAASARVAAQGFGLPLLISFTAAWPERVREYTSLSGVGVDFATTTPEYKAAAKLFGQTPRVPRILIGRAALKPTQRWAITPVAVNSYTYRMTVNGNAISFTADATATVTEIITGLKAAIDALALAVTVTDQTTFMRIVANVAGAHFQVSTGNDSNLAIAQDHADPGIATDLAAIVLERNDWFWLLTTHHSKALIDAAATWASGARKLYVAQTQDSAVRDTVRSGTDDVGESQYTAASDFVSLWYSYSNEDFLDAGLVGKIATLQPGTYTAKFKQLSGVNASLLTPTQRSNLGSKRVNFYEPTAAVNITEEGVTSSAKFLDAVVFTEYLQARIGERVFGKLAAANKVPYTDRGAQQLLGEVKGFLQTEEARETIDRGWTAEPLIPAASQSSTDRSNRLFQGLQFACVYSGAIHRVAITGSITF